ncbi:uncharacterized protein LOC106663904 isoform X3 [Cimex lectularius]|uniref:Uncharacterized protein n=1 Tax=Cimex lectularius TaxID=79782 RepID=A0A8I6TER2_CIMLE|nr:uncharacterized protein LOC106663904 isoform X3 [Cimex lectularius]
MGQCTSSKSSQIEGFLGKKRNNIEQQANNKKTSKMDKGGKGAVTRGQATRFGFKRPPLCPSPSLPPTAPPALPSVPAAQVTRETIEPIKLTSVQLRNGTPKLGRSKKDTGKAANRFGFVPPPSLSNKVSDLKQEGQSGHAKNTISSSALKLSARSRSETRYNKPSQKNNSSNLSNCNSVANSNTSINSDIGRGPSDSQASYKHQATARIPTSANYSSSYGSTAADKRAKTVANNQTARTSQINDQKVNRNNSVLEIQQLEHSPSLGHKFRHAHTKPATNNQKARPMEMVFNPAPGKRFDLRDLIPIQTVDRNERVEAEASPPQGTRHEGQHSLIAERIRREVVLTPPTLETNEDDKQGEEKQRRDKKASEKIHQSSGEESTGEEELWAGPGEAMAMDESMVCSAISELDHSPETMNQPLRSVLLRIEDPTFATLAAFSNSGMLEDETSPESPDISCSSPSSVEPLPPPPQNLSKPGTPDTPGSPTHGTNSLSSDTKERDFLIDDEIADQPGLVFDSAIREEPSILDTSRTIAKIAGEVSQVLASVDQNGGLDHLNRLNKQHGSTNSVGTLSPCESLASDDLMADFDKSDVSAFDDVNHSSESPLKSEILNRSDQVIKEWNALLHSHPGLNGIRTSSKPTKTRLRSSASGTGEVKPKSNVSSPHKTKQQQVVRLAGDDASDDSGIKVNGFSVQHLAQDVSYIKSMLLRLQRVLQEPENQGLYENGLMEILESPQGGIPSVQPAGEPLEVRDLRRQLELEEKDRQMLKLKEELKISNDRMSKFNMNQEKVKYSNMATQTDRIRPASTTLFQNSPDSAKASFVSMNDTQDEIQKHRPTSGGHENEGVVDLIKTQYTRTSPEHHHNNRPSSKQYSYRIS